ncbi:MAG: hypothetical protein JNM07_03240 [Phycisphaerae bacterium]|nr:hypothetical protein [Phycisphaerae bacterium]
MKRSARGRSLGDAARAGMVAAALGGGWGTWGGGCARHDARAPSGSTPVVAVTEARAESGAAPIEVRPAARDAREFVPSVHGFPFVNSFRGAMLGASLKGLTDRLSMPETFGLCGGMSAAAADFFLARRTVPGGNSPPPEGSPLYDYLFRRQSDSLGPGWAVGLTYLEWMQMADDPPPGADPARDIRARTAAELRGIRSRLDAGELVVLGLVYSRAGPGGGAVWDNHQVLAFRVESNAKEGSWDFRIYDSNYPGNDGVLVRVTPAIMPGGGGGGGGGSGDARAAAHSGIPDRVACARLAPGHRPKVVRGVFAMPYVRNEPPDELFR